MRSISTVILLLVSVRIFPASLQASTISPAIDLEQRAAHDERKQGNEAFLSAFPHFFDEALPLSKGSDLNAVKAPAMLLPEAPILEIIVPESTSAEIDAPEPQEYKPDPKQLVLTVRTNVRVVATLPKTETNEGYERTITPKEIESSAGTFGDPSRYMQMLPGVVSDNDRFNDIVVRGGNPQEIRFIVDNIEIPSVNQLALSNTTGGFVSMIDNAAVQRIVLHTDSYDSKFDQRLSGIVEISTREDQKSVPKTQFELGIAGLGGSTRHPWGQNGSTFFSGRRSILNLVTNDIGMNGVPIYSNGLFRADKRISDKDSFWGLTLTGVDSMEIHPSATNNWETNPYDIKYSGWRNTSGINWQHIYSSKSFGVASFGNSEQSQSVGEKAQLLNDATVYAEDTRDGISTLKYDHTVQWNPWFTLTGGGRTSMDRLHYQLDQPLGLQNPYSEDDAPSNAFSLNRKFTTFSSAGYMQGSILLPHGMKAVIGERVSQWAILGKTDWTPKVLFMAPIFGRLTHVGYSEYSQLPATLHLLSFENETTLKPIRSKQITWGIDALQTQHVRVSLEAYQKRYTDYPVATLYPQLSLANIANTFGQAFLMFPMSSKGKGLGRGVELSVTYRPTSRVTLTTALTYSRIWYSGLDGVLRRGNFDIPVVGNVAGTFHIKKSVVLSFRYSGASGKPYTPDNEALSQAQNRDVFDLSRVNGVRAPAYSRLDFRIEHSYLIGRGIFTWHVGLENALGTKNFYSNEWRPRCTECGVLAQEQMPRFPDGGFQYSF